MFLTLQVHRSHRGGLRQLRVVSKHRNLILWIEEETTFSSVITLVAIREVFLEAQYRQEHTM
jgi:hypothetical protein